ncbi:MAG: hypothetical protein EBU90_30100 [Proteobacteria bacterium]|nr:hypothetical protein [Pseudomonadota bacterium]
MKVWIDPPSGWRYGFPKIYDPDCGMPVMDWLVSEGYPQAEIDALGQVFFTRSWGVDEDADDQPRNFCHR